MQVFFILRIFAIKIILKKKLTHKSLTIIGKQWLKNQGGKQWSCGVIFTELVTLGNETPDILGIASYGSTLIEVKASRADFLRDKKKIFRRYPEMGMGGYRFYLCPTNFIKKKDLPESWGLIYVNERGKGRIIVKPEYQERNLKSENAYIYSVIRRLYNGNCKDIQTFFRRYT